MRKALILLTAICGLTAAQDRQTIAIYMAGEEPEGARGVHSILGGELARIISQSEKYSAVDRTDAIQQQLGREMTFQMSGAVSDDQIKRLGQQFGVQYLCIANISNVRSAVMAMGGQSYYLDVRLVDVVTAEIIRTATTTSSLRNAVEMRRIAQEIANELIDFKRVREEREQKKRTFFYTAIGLDVLGAGLLAYGIYENMNVGNLVGDKKFTDADRAVTRRNAAYIAGSVILAGGITIHILF